MNLRKFFPLLFIGACFTTSCSTDEEPNQPETPEAKYDNGVFILNEGNYGNGNSTISFLDKETMEVSHQIFNRENGGELLGDTGQNLAFYKNYAFIVMNVSNTIVVVDRHNFKHVITIDDNLDNPRFITFAEGKAFVTNWGDGMDPADDFVSVFNAETFASNGKISVSEGPERIVSGPGKVFVAHTGGFNLNDKISVIDPVKNELNTTVSVGVQPNSLVVEGDHLWVLSGGHPSYSNDESAGSLSMIDLGTLSVATELTFQSASDHPANLDMENDILYYTLGTEVFAMEKTDTSLPHTPVFEMEPVEILYGFNIEGSKIYAASARFDFSSNGKLFVYDLTGNLENTISTGVNPNSVFFNE